MPIKGKGRGRPAKNEHKLCKPLPVGEVLTDLKKKCWKIGKPLGSGGFGLIYTADESSNSAVMEDAPYVIKVEPHGNGPLYSEIAFYQRVAKFEQIEEFRKKKRLSYIPVPPYIAHGLHTSCGESLRFLVMPRFGSDLHKLWLKANKKFKRETVAKIALIMVDALEYIHSREYVHADIKGANILCDTYGSNKLYLVDYGLAARYTVDSEHKKYKPDPRKAHNGTIEYTSTDAHDGAGPSRRGDLEILGLFLLHLIAGRLPWEDNLGNCNYVKDQKKKHLRSPETLVKSTCGTSIPEISQLLQLASNMEYEEDPNYEKIRKFFKDALKSLKVSPNSSLNFGSDGGHASRRDSTPAKKEKPKPKKRKLVAPRQAKPKLRRRADSSSLDDAVSSGEDQSSPSRESTSAIGATSSSFPSDDDDFAVPKPSAAAQRRKKKPVVLASDSEDTENLCSEDDGDIVETTPARNKRKANFKSSESAKRTVGRKKLNPINDNQKVVENGHVEIFPKPSRPPMLKKLQTRQNTPKTSTLLPSTSGSGPCSDDVVSDASSDDDVASPKRRSSNRHSKSRHSMAPLHTDPVLLKTDKLTGKYSGKHPVFVRRQKKNKVPRTDASTQTTPTLGRTRSKK